MILKNRDKNNHKNTYNNYVINLWIPVTLQYRYTVCCGVLKSNMYLYLWYLFWKHHG